MSSHIVRGRHNMYFFFITLLSAVNSAHSFFTSVIIAQSILRSTTYLTLFLTRNLSPGKAQADVRYLSGAFKVVAQN